jgi:hypothetical protein
MRSGIDITEKDYFTNSGMSVPYYLVGKYRLKNAGIIALNQAAPEHLKGSSLLIIL